MEYYVKKIKEFEDYYISNLGEVFSSKGHKVSQLKPEVTHDGYLKVSLRREGRTFRKAVHRLVAETFMDNPERYSQVNHLNEDKKDNSVINLEWCSAKINMNHGSRNHRISSKMSKPVIALNDSGVEVLRFGSTIEAGKNGFTQTSVAACCRGARKSHKGYTWKYI